MEEQRLYVWGLSRQVQTAKLSRSMWISIIPCFSSSAPSRGSLSEVMERHGGGGQKHRWPPWLTLGCRVVCPLDGVDAGEAPQRTRDGSVRVGECGGTDVHGRQDDTSPQIRDHSNIARAYTALGKDGVEEVNALILHVAQDRGFADASILSSDTTAQELPIGYPNEPGILRGWAQRCGRALAKLKPAWGWGSIRLSRRCRRSSGRSKNTTCLPRANRKSARC